MNLLTYALIALFAPSTGAASALARVQATFMRNTKSPPGTS